MLGRVSFCQVMLTIYSMYCYISLNDKRDRITCSGHCHPDDFKIKDLSNVSGMRYDSRVLGNLRRILNASLYYIRLV